MAKYLIERGHTCIRWYIDTDGEEDYIFESTEQLRSDRLQFLDELFKD